MKPVAWMDDFGNVFEMENKFFYIPLYTHPAKTLTDEEIIEVHINTPFIDGYLNKNLINFARAILRKAQE